MQTFRSRHHPGSAPLALIYARALARWFGAAMVTVMVVTVAAMLRQQPVLATLAWAIPAIWVVATGWTVYQLRRTIAEVQLEGSLGQVRSVWDVALGWRTPPMQAVHTPRRIDGVLHVGVGHTVHRFEQADWPAFRDLAAALKQAARHAEAARYRAAAP